MANSDKVFIKGLVLMLRVGIYDQERAAAQRVILNASFDVQSNLGKPLMDIAEVVSYENAITVMRAVAERTHYDLLENLAEEIINALRADKRIQKITLSLEKPDIIEGTQSVGIEISRDLS